MRRHLKLVPPRPPEEVAAPVLESRGIGMLYGLGAARGPVLEDITFKVADGELICILGPSGCGKTTLLKLIGGFEKPTSGRVLMAGEPVRAPGPDRCFIFQEDALFPWLTVAENIAFGLKGRPEARERRRDVARYLERVGLEPYADYLPREISGGMKQRVALARVLILKPRVLLMDEPFGALDAQTREEMQHLLLSLRQEFSHTIVFVTHDISEAAYLADRILLMGSGPGRILDTLKVPLPRPREKESEPFNRFCIQLRKRL